MILEDKILALFIDFSNFLTADRLLCPVLQFSALSSNLSPLYFYMIINSLKLETMLLRSSFGYSLLLLELYSVPILGEIWAY